MSASAVCTASDAEVTHDVSEELEAGHDEVDDEACDIDAKEILTEVVTGAV